MLSHTQHPASLGKHHPPDFSGDIISMSELRQTTLQGFLTPKKSHEGAQNPGAEPHGAPIRLMDLNRTPDREGNLSSNRESAETRGESAEIRGESGDTNDSTWGRHKARAASSSAPQDSQASQPVDSSLKAIEAEMGQLTSNLDTTASAGAQEGKFDGDDASGDPTGTSKLENKTPLEVLKEQYVKVRALSPLDVRHSPPNVQRNGSFYLQLPTTGKTRSNASAYLNYEPLRDGSGIRLLNTYVHPHWRGMGIGHLLADAAYEFANRNGLRVEVACPYIRTVYLPRVASMYPDNVEYTSRVPSLTEEELYPPSKFFKLPHHPSKASFWRRICAVMSMRITNTSELVNAFYHLFHDDLETNFQLIAKGVASFIEDRLTSEEREKFFGKTLPFIQVLVLELPRVVKDACTWGNPHYIPLLRRRQHVPFTVLTLPRIVLASLNACAFFSLLPWTDATYTSDEAARGTGRQKYHQCSYRRMFISQMTRQRTAQKLRCLLHYFTVLHDRVVAACKSGDPYLKTAENISGNVSFYRVRAHLTPSVKAFITAQTGAGSGKETDVGASDAPVAVPVNEALSSDPAQPVANVSTPIAIIADQAADVVAEPSPIPVWQECLESIAPQSTWKERTLLATQMHEPSASSVSSTSSATSTESNSVQIKLSDFERFAVGNVATSVIVNAITSLNTPLCNVKIVRHGGIEDETQVQTLQVDFANAYLGGGALGSGCVQEEIRFMINPECIPGILLCEAMEDSEAILILGTERFSNYSGYAQSFKFEGPHDDPTPKDSKGRISTAILAIDALAYVSPEQQYRVTDVTRELMKAFVGFSIPLADFDAKSAAQKLEAVRQAREEKAYAEYGSLRERALQGGADEEDLEELLNLMLDDARRVFPEGSGEFQVISTGNWGCGAFNGDHQLKFIIQWIAATAARRSIRYFTFDDPQIENLGEFIDGLQAKASSDEAHHELYTPKALWELTCTWIETRTRTSPHSSKPCSKFSVVPANRDESLFDYILRAAEVATGLE